MKASKVLNVAHLISCHICSQKNKNKNNINREKLD